LLYVMKMKDADNGLTEAVKLAAKVKALASNISKISQDELKGKKCGAVARKIMLVEAQQLEEAVRKISNDAQHRASKAIPGSESRAALLKAATEAKRLEESVKRLNSEAIMLGGSAHTRHSDNRTQPSTQFRNGKISGSSPLDPSQKPTTIVPATLGRQMQPDQSLSNSFSFRRKYSSSVEILRPPRNNFSFRRVDAPKSRVDEFTEAFTLERLQLGPYEEDKKAKNENSDEKGFSARIAENLPTQKGTAHAQGLRQKPNSVSEPEFSVLSTKMTQENNDQYSKPNESKRKTAVADSDDFDEYVSNAVRQDSIVNVRIEESKISGLYEANSRAANQLRTTKGPSRGNDRDEGSLKSMKSKSSRRTIKSIRSDRTKDSDLIMIESVVGPYFNENSRSMEDFTLSGETSDQAENSSVSTNSPFCKDIPHGGNVAGHAENSSVSTNSPFCKDIPHGNVAVDSFPDVKLDSTLSQHSVQNVGSVKSRASSTRRSPEHRPIHLANGDLENMTLFSKSQSIVPQEPLVECTVQEAVILKGSHNKRSDSGSHATSRSGSQATSRSTSLRKKIWQAIRSRGQSEKESSSQTSKTENAPNQSSTQISRQQIDDDVKSISSRKNRTMMSQRTEESDQKTEESDQKTEESDQKTEESDQKTEESDQKTEESDQKTEESDQETEESDQKTEDRDQNTTSLKNTDSTHLAISDKQLGNQLCDDEESSKEVHRSSNHQAEHQSKPAFDNRVVEGIDVVEGDTDPNFGEYILDSTDDSFENTALPRALSITHGSIQEAVSAISDDNATRATYSSFSDSASYAELVKYMSFQENLERGFEVLLQDSELFRKKYFPVIAEEDNESESDDDISAPVDNREDVSSVGYHKTSHVDERMGGDTDEHSVISNRQGSMTHHASRGTSIRSINSGQRRQSINGNQSSLQSVSSSTKKINEKIPTKALADDIESRSSRSFKSKRSTKSNKPKSGWSSVPPQNIRIKSSNFTKGKTSRNKAIVETVQSTDA
jgi:hypothetical protein